MSTNYRRFDLLNFASKITEPAVCVQVLKSTAWRMDALITGLSRRVLKSIRDKLVIEAHVDNYTSASALLRDIGEAEEWFKKTGLDKGTFEEITRLTALRQEYHEKAQELDSLLMSHSVVRMQFYEIPDLEDVFHAPANDKPSSLALSRASMSSAALAQAFNIDAKTFAERRKDALIRKAKDRADAVNNTADLAWWCYTAILQYPKDELAAMKAGETVVTQQDALEQGFSFLSKETQVTLITNARQAAERAVSWAEEDRNLTEIEFARILACGISTVQYLERVLKADNFQLVD